MTIRIGSTRPIGRLRRAGSAAAALLTLLASGCAYRQAKAPAPASAETRSAFSRQVRNAVDAGDGDPAVRDWQRHLIRHPEDIEARRRLASHFERMGEWELAAEHRRLAAERNPESEQLWMEWAQALRRPGMTADAEAVLSRAASHMASAPLLSLLGIVRDELGDHERAEQAHRQAIANAAAPDSSLHNNLGYSLLLQGRHAEAAAQFRQALALRKHFEVARGNLARALAAEGSPASREEALLNWKSVTSPAAAHNNLAAVLIEQGKFAEARAELREALAADRNHRAALANLVLVSELDGGRAELRAASPAGPWRRFGWMVRSWFRTGSRETVAPERAAR
jgi:Flp pilus assembly protein TadD